MALSSSHLTALRSTASRLPSASAFKIPSTVDTNGEVQWSTISYSQFLFDVELSARYWAHKLAADAVPVRSVVGMWLGGMGYTDVIQIYGVSRAGYVPQLFSLRLPNPTVIYELLEKAKAKALICDASFESNVSDCRLPVHIAADLSKMATAQSEPLPPFPMPTSADDLVFIFHTSGSTSGSPKLVPCRYSWVDGAIMKSRQTGLPKKSEQQDVCTWMGSMCHIGQTFMLLGSIQHGSCTIQPTQINFSSSELFQMVQKCNLNRLHQFAAFLQVHIRHSKSDSKLLALLQHLDVVLYSGLPLAKEEEEFAYSKGIPLMNLFGSTECGAMMLSQVGKDFSARLLRPLSGVKYDFVAITSTKSTGHVSANAQLHELVILAESPDCPDYSLRKSDGHFHTGDLFQEIKPGQYLFRGRDDDWIKSQNSLRCDTRAIEDHVRATCGDLVGECIVVGTGRPSPALFVEPSANDKDHYELKKEIIRRTRQFHSRRYLHERITSVEFIIIVGRGELPRTATKGNIRRQAVEETYKEILDAVYEVED